MEATLIIIKGNVQGIFYRAFAKSEAEKLNIKGYVKNLNNGNVEIIAVGESNNLNKFIEILGKGPEGAIIKGINFKEIETEKLYKGFNITY